MKPIFIFALTYTFAVAACSQQDSAGGYLPAINHTNLPVGQSSVSLKQFVFDNPSPFVLLHLHGDELSAAEAANAVARRWGIGILQLVNMGERMISFHYEGQFFQFDPNRIFSEEGIRQTLLLSGLFSDAAFQEVQRFSDSLLTFLNRYETIVSVHNNTNGRFTIRQYLSIDPDRVHVNNLQDEDDFFITNDAALFTALKAENYNVVWEDATRMEEDGSLSLYCYRNNIRYINVEAQHGHTANQIAMLEVVKRILE